MSYSMPGSSGTEVVTQESLLLSAVERIAKIRAGRLAVQLHLSRLLPQNRQDGHIRIALRMLEPMVNAYRGQMFLLLNTDVVFMVKDANLTDVENMIFKLRALFSKDPLTFDDTGDGVDRFCTWFDLGGREYDSFLEICKGLSDGARDKQRHRTVAPVETKPLDPKQLGELVGRLADMDITQLIRRQAAVVFNERRDASVLFQEFFVSTPDLRKALAPEVNLLANRWLFQHLSVTLDRRMLAAMREPPLRQYPPIVALNLNIATILSPAFADFSKAVQGKYAIAVEFQILDVLADSPGYYKARARLREAGHQVTIDGLSELTLQLMDVTQFEADLYKLSWSPEMSEMERGTALTRSLSPLGSEKLLLARCDSEAAIKWGLDHGISRFQGRYVDTMIAAVTMAVCDKAAACTLGQCIARHGVIIGFPRIECGNLEMLDSPPLIATAPTRTKASEARA